MVSIEKSKMNLYTADRELIAHGHVLLKLLLLNNETDYPFAGDFKYLRFIESEFTTQNKLI